MAIPTLSFRLTIAPPPVDLTGAAPHDLPPIPRRNFELSKICAHLPFGAPTKYGKGGVAEPRTKARATSSLLGTELLEGVEVFWVVPGKCQTPGCTFSK